MVRLLSRIFVKDRDNVKSPAVRRAYGTMASVTGIITNILLAAAKLLAGTLSGSISMPFASPWEGITPVETVDAIIEAYLAVGIDEISLSDASGMATPVQVNALCTHVREKYPQASWWLHFHNTRGMAMANLIAAMDAGMTRFDTSFGGLGGCPFVPGAAGNLSTEDVVHLCDGSGIETGVDILKVMEISRKLQEQLGHKMESYVLRAGRSVDLIAAHER